jgi:hypothetical protein
MSWINTYREGEISPVGTISGDRPGHKLAKVITEVQEKVVIDADPVNASSLVTIDAQINDNTLVISIRDIPQPEPTDEEEQDGVDPLPTVGTDGMYLRYNPNGPHYWDYIRAIDFTVVVP